MENKIEELKNSIDTLTIQEALNTAQLKTLTNALWEISYQLFDKESVANLQDNYYHTLYEKSEGVLSQPDLLYNPSRAHFALLDLKSFVDAHLQKD